MSRKAGERAPGDGAGAATIRTVALAALACGVVGVTAAAARPTSTVASSLAFPAGAPAGNSGGFGEPSCVSCHVGEALDDPAGSLTIDGVPARFVAGQTYRLTIRLRHADMRAGGFQLTSRLAVGPGGGAGAQVGTLAPVDQRTAIELLDGVQYITHTESGIAAPEGRAAWTVAWTAPAAATAPMVFNVAGNAANGDESPFSDLIYVRADTIRPAPPR